MKIIYDISVLAWSIKSNKAKTGIFRVIENVLFQLLKDPSVELHLSSIHGNICDVREYLKNHGIHLEERKLLFPKDPSPRKDFLFKYYQWFLNQLDWRNFPLLSKWLKSIFCLLVDPLLFLLGLNEYLRPIPTNLLSIECIFHSTFLPIPSYILKSNIRKIISIYDVISLQYPEYFQGNQDEVVWKLIRDLKKTDSVITISEYSKKDILLCSDSIKENQIFVTPLAASKIFFKETSDQKIIDVLTKFGLKRGRYILSVATLEPRKNLKNTIQAFFAMKCLPKNPDLKLVLIGGKGWGPEKENLLGDLSKEEQSRIVFVGFVSDELLASIYTGSQFFVYMSFYEGFGLPPLEAMQCGVPVLVSNTSSLPEVVGDTGMYASPHDITEISRGMENYIENKALREEMAHRSLERVGEFTWEKTASLTKQVYQRLYENNH